MWTRQSLTTHLAKGHHVDFLFFWGHTPKSPGRVDASCLSQWFPAPFVIDGIRYATAEHFMMAEKARLFGDADALSNILGARSPAEAKALGRTVRHYDDDAWSAARIDAVVRGNLAKFGQDDALGSFLRSTGRKILVEVSPHDRIWGIGLGGSNPAAHQPSQWRGQNLLGFALTEVRARLFETTKD